MEKKIRNGGKSLALVCLELHFIDVPLHCWWIDVRASNISQVKEMINVSLEEELKSAQHNKVCELVDLPE